jgi:hypothetical protein
MYKFRHTSIPPQLDLETNMSKTAGSELRFSNRFIKYAGTSEEFNKKLDQSGQAIDDLRTANGVITEQKKAVDKMLLKAEEAINSISALNKESGVQQIENIPLPTNATRASYGKKMGYNVLVMEFLTAGLLHFMEETLNLEEALKSRDAALSRLAAQIPQLEIMGAYEPVDISDLITAPTVDASTYVKADKPTTPVMNTPKKQTSAVKK